MKQQLKLFTTVCIKQFVSATNDYDNFGFNQRPPQVGDTGAVVDILTAEMRPSKYVVESVASNGDTVWLAEFFAEELEVVQSQ